MIGGCFGEAKFSSRGIIYEVVPKMEEGYAK
jgi:hypothetical protein